MKTPLKTALGAIARRLAEPSTYAGLSGLATMIGMSNPQFLAYCAGAAFVFGLVAVMLPERSK